MKKNKKQKKSNLNLIVSLIVTIVFFISCIFLYYYKNSTYTVEGLKAKADYYFSNKEYSKAVRHYLKSIEFKDTTQTTYVNLITALIKTNNYKLASEFLAKTEFLTEETYYLLAYTNYKLLQLEHKTNTNFDEVIQYLEKSIELNNSYSKSYILLGKLYEQQNKYDIARKWYNKAISAKIENNEIFYEYIANSYLKEEKFNDAIKYYKKAIATNKNFLTAYCNIAQIYQLQKKYNEAVKIYIQVIKLDNEYIFPYYKIGNIYDEQNDFQNAINWYSKALKIDKNNLLVNYYIGMSYKNLNDIDNAIKYLKIAAFCGNDDALEELKIIKKDLKNVL